MITKAYDCSNSLERPAHRQESGGPKENDIIRGLKKYCSAFDYEFVSNPNDADVIITNDVFPKDILEFNKPMVKRMDGVYWDNRVKDRNVSLNKASTQADKVIFISRYSKDSFEKLCEGFLMQARVILNTVDESVFFHEPKIVPNKHFTWTSSATNWAREEKRFDDMMVFADSVMDKDDMLVLIGKCDKKLTYPPHHNVVPVGYFNSEKDTNDILNSADAFINLSYRDAAPKTVCQAVNCKLPILYADSGGTRELVVSGYGIIDSTDFIFEDKVPRLNVEHMRQGYNFFKKNYQEYRALAWARKSTSYMEMLGKYFRTFDEAIKQYE